MAELDPNYKETDAEIISSAMAPIVRVALRLNGHKFDPKVPSPTLVSAPKPSRHDELLHHIHDFENHEFGFLDAWGTFLNREAAFVRAVRNGQLQNPLKGKFALYSDDLW